MDTDLPLLDHDRIARAAEGMISNHGKGALAEADRRIQTLRFSGCDSTAAAWESIREIIQVRIGGSPRQKKRDAKCVDASPCS